MNEIRTRVTAFVEQHAAAIERALTLTAEAAWGPGCRVIRLDDQPWNVTWLALPPMVWPLDPWEPRCRVYLTFDAAGGLVRVAVSYHDPHPAHRQELHVESDELTEASLERLLRTVPTPVPN